MKKRKRVGFSLEKKCQYGVETGLRTVISECGG